MKILLFPALLLAVPAFAQMQPPPPARFKGANTIVATTADSASTAWRSAQQTLLEKGYNITQSSRELYSFTTAPKAVGKSRQLTISGFIKSVSGGTEISYSGAYSYLTANLGGMSTTTVNRPVIWQGGAFGVDSDMFELIQAVAAAVPNQKKPLNFIAR